MDELRGQIDKIDQEIIRLLGKRFEVSRNIAGYKRKNNLKVRDNRRFTLMIKERKELAAKRCLPSNLIENLYTTIHHYSVLEQERLINEKQ